MRLTWYGTAALVLREGDAAICFDPFCGIPVHGLAHPERTLPYEKEFRDVTDVFITHGHFDHIYHIPRLYRDVPLRLRCTRTPRKLLTRHGIRPEQIREIRPGVREEVGPFTVTAYQSRHCKFDLPLIARTVLRARFFRHPVHLIRLLKVFVQYPENGEILFYEVLGGGKRIQIMGSLNLSENVEYPTGADLLILPFQGRSGLEEYGLKLVRRLRPKEVLLDHYDDAFPPISDTIHTKDFETLLWEREGIPCRTMVKGDIYGKTEETLGRS